MRKLKPLKVETVFCQATRRSADLMFDRNEKMFFAKVGEETIEHATAHECKTKTLQALRVLTPHVWERVIMVDVEAPPDSSRSYYYGHHHAGERTEELKLEIERFEVSQRHDKAGWLKRCFFDDLGKESEKAARNADPLHRAESWHRYTDDASKLPYTEELWVALVALADGIVEARKRAIALTKNAEGLKRLVALGAGNLLSAGTPANDEKAPSARKPPKKAAR